MSSDTLYFDSSQHLDTDYVESVVHEQVDIVSRFLVGKIDDLPVMKAAVEALGRVSEELTIMGTSTSAEYYRHVRNTTDTSFFEDFGCVLNAIKFSSSAGYNNSECTETGTSFLEKTTSFVSRRINELDRDQAIASLEILRGCYELFFKAELPSTGTIVRYLSPEI